MARVCRTCLKYTYKTYKTQDCFGDFPEFLKISVVLRYLMPELYLGITINPEICHECRENLRIAYIFKKTCLRTENAIGSYLKSVRCTARCINLDEVLDFMDKEAKKKLPPKPTNPNAQKILSDWEDDLSEDLSSEAPFSLEAVDKEGPPQLPYVNNLIPDKFKDLKFCDEFGLFIDKNGKFFTSEGAPVDNSQIEAEKAIVENKVSFPQISCVFSLSEDKNENKSSEINQNGTIRPMIRLAQIETLIEKSPTTVPSQIKSLTTDTSQIKSSTTETSPIKLLTTETPQTKSLTTDALQIESSTKENPQIKSSTTETTVTGNAQIKASEKESPQIKPTEMVFPLKEVTQTEDLTKHSQPVQNVARNTFDYQHPDDCLIDIKEEPLDRNIFNDEYDINYLRDDEDTLTASETTTYDDIQGIIDNLQNTYDGNQYIDIPEFVQINNFSVRDLEALRQSQSNKGELNNSFSFQNTFASLFKCPEFDQPKPIEQNPPEKLERVPPTSFQNSFQNSIVENFKPTYETGYVSRFRVAEESEKSAVNVNAKLPETLVINGKTMFKCSDGYRLATYSSQELNLQGLLNEAKSIHPIPKTDRSSNLKLQSILKRRPGTEDKNSKSKRKLKIVAVNDGNNETQFTPEKTKNKKNDVCVLFTNYTWDGLYINDHDYLVAPYKRNKVLIEQGEEQFCMCFICGIKHLTQEHVGHMSHHNSVCPVCKVNLGTAYMLNLHVRSHTKSCKFCTERIFYGEALAHEMKHLKEDREFEAEKEKNYHHKGKKRKVDEDWKPIYLPRTSEHDSVNEDIPILEVTDKSPAEEIHCEIGSSNSSPRRRLRRRKTETEDCTLVEKSFRVLRSNVKKSTKPEDVKEGRSSMDGDCEKPPEPKNGRKLRSSMDVDPEKPTGSAQFKEKGPSADVNPATLASSSAATTTTPTTTTPFDITRKSQLAPYYEFSSADIDQYGKCLLCEKKGTNRFFKMPKGNLSALLRHLSSAHVVEYCELFDERINQEYLIKKDSSESG